MDCCLSNKIFCINKNGMKGKTVGRIEHRELGNASYVVELGPRKAVDWLARTSKTLGVILAVRQRAGLINELSVFSLALSAPGALRWRNTGI